MIANALRAEIDSYAARARTTNPIFVKAETGTLTALDVRRYLVNVHHLVLHTPPHLERARGRALASHETLLAKHYAHKLGEEAGHDAWAERDITRLSSAPMVRPLPSNASVEPAMADLVAFIAATIDEDPCLYLAYILFAEQITVLLGPEWIKLLEERCGIPRASMTVVGNHAELDREHVEEALDEIDDLVGDPRKLPRMREVLLQSIDYFDRFCEEVTKESASDIRSLRDSAAQVSAA